MFTFDIRRFTPGQMSRAHWMRESSHEAYVRNYNIVFPQDEPLAGRDASHDALHQELVDDGAVMQARAGWERPAFFMEGEKVGYWESNKKNNMNPHYTKIISVEVFKLDTHNLHNVEIG